MVWYLRDLPTHGKGQRGKEVSHLAPLNATQLMTRGQGSRAPGRHRELRRSTSVAQMALLKGESEEGMRTPGYTPESEVTLKIVSDQWTDRSRGTEVQAVFYKSTPPD